jgi:hypothetical protein
MARFQRGFGAPRAIGRTRRAAFAHGRVATDPAGRREGPYEAMKHFTSRVEVGRTAAGSALAVAESADHRDEVDGMGFMHDLPGGAPTAGRRGARYALRHAQRDSAPLPPPNMPAQRGIGG